MRLFLNPALPPWLTPHYPHTQAVLLNNAVYQTLPSPLLLFHCNQLTETDPEHVKSSHFGLNTAHTSSDAWENWCWQTSIRGYLCGGWTVSLTEPWVREEWVIENGEGGWEWERGRTGVKIHYRKNVFSPKHLSFLKACTYYLFRLRSNLVLGVCLKMTKTSLAKCAFLIRWMSYLLASNAQ